jgi:DNA-binding transcriptional ArsR family regulator
MRIVVGPADIAACRYTISPLGEVMSLLRVTSGHRAAGPIRTWIDRLRPRYDAVRRADPAVGALVALFRRGGYNADFIQPPPARTGLTFADELAAVRATPLRRARHELARNLAGHRTPSDYAKRILDSPDVVERLAGAIETLWAVLVEPDWPRLRAILERDIVQRAGQLVAYGWASALAGLDPRLRWSAEGYIDVRDNDGGTIHLAGQGLLFVPTVYGTLITYVEPPWPYAIVYRARGVADLLGPARARQSPEALDRLVGGTRASVLRALAAPATTSQLVATLGLGLGSVGNHLVVLRDAGVVQRTRVGRTVRYTPTPLGEALVNP